VVEVDVMTDDDPMWTVAGPGPNVQSRAHALDVDDMGRYHIVNYTCDDLCVPDGEVRVYEPGGVLAAQVQLGPLGSLWLGPHDIAWSPAGYAVVAFGELQDQDSVFKVQAVAPGKPEPLWTVLPQDRQGDQLGLADGGGSERRGLRRGLRQGRPSGVRGHRWIAAGRQPGGGTNASHATSTRLAASANAGPSRGS
jgi:hypothetical protein